MEHGKDPASSSEKPSWLLGLLAILAYFFAVFSLSKIHTPLRYPRENSNNPQQPQDYTCNTTQTRQNLSTSTVHVVVDSAPETPTPNKKRETRETDQERRDKRRLFIEGITAFFLLAYTFTTILLWLSTKSANQLTHEAIILGQRPWVGVNIPQITKYQYVPNTGYVEFTISFGIKNFGVSPALHVVPGRDIRGGDVTLEQLENALDSKCISDSDMTRNQLVRGGSGYTLFPNTPHIEEWETAMSKGSYDLKKPAYIIACVTYKDQFKDTGVHHTPVCYHTRGGLEQIKVPEDFVPCFWGQNAD